MCSVRMAYSLVDNETECAICKEVFTDPRVLPCVHTFCLKCIQGWGKDKFPGKTLACPLCRNGLTIPENGVEGLPRNLYVEKMLRVRELTSVEAQSTLCNMCTYRATSEAAKIDPATTYCLQCQEAFCETCASVHGKLKATHDHILYHIGDKVKPEDLYAQYPRANNCDKHVDEALEIYCNECRLVICMLCYIKDHSSHKCSDLQELVDEFRRQMATDVSGVTSGVDKCQQTLQNLTTEKKDFHEKVSKSEREIREKTKQLKQMIDRHEESLLAELKSIQQKRIKEIEAAYEEVESQLTARQSYTKYVHEILEKGSARDIIRESSYLHDRADELLKADFTKSSLGQAEVTFISDDDKKDVGKLQFSKFIFMSIMSLSIALAIAQS